MPTEFHNSAQSEKRLNLWVRFKLPECEMRYLVPVCPSYHSRLSCIYLPVWSLQLAHTVPQASGTFARCFFFPVRHNKYRHRGQPRTLTPEPCSRGGDRKAPTRRWFVPGCAGRYGHVHSSFDRAHTLFMETANTAGAFVGIFSPHISSGIPIPFTHLLLPFSPTPIIQFPPVTHAHLPWN